MRYSSLLFIIVACVLALSGLSAGFSPYENEGGTQPKGLGDGPELPFEPNDYDFLIYDCGGGENSIRAAMDGIGLTYTVRDSSSPVTLNDLNSHDVLIVGWSSGGNKGGLNTNVIEEGITGRVILSGHDSDYHTVHGPEHATTFFIQEIEYVLQGQGTGLIVCADIDNNLNWLPESWGVTAAVVAGQYIGAFTQDGLDSGVYDGLTPANMSNWGTSYHNTFEYTGLAFRTFEVDTAYRAVTIATPISPSGVEFWKDDGIEEPACVQPDDEIVYEIGWHNMAGVTLYNVQIVDHLPEHVTYPRGTWTVDPNTLQLIPPDPAYDPHSHSYIWNIGDVYHNDSGSVTLSVVVDEGASPGVALENIATMTADGVIVGWASVKTPMRCWDTVDPNIIYVDCLATGNNNGSSWEDSYTSLQSALERATESTCDVGPYTILVAQGIYSPGDSAKNTFLPPSNASLFGGFPTGGGDFSARNPAKYPTILTGRIDQIHRNDCIVTMGQDTLISGFTITEAAEYGIHGSDVDFVVEECKIETSDNYGIWAANGNVFCRWSNITANKLDGIRHEGAGYTIQIDNCWIRQSGRYGLVCGDSTPLVRNSIVSESDMSEAGNEGILMVNPSYSPVLQNVTVAHNKAAGIALMASTLPNMQNCIVYHNNNDGQQLVGFTADDAAWYSCIQDCNDVNLNYNINVAPKFAYFDPNNVHIASDSPCRNVGNPSLNYDNQVDMDGFPRLSDTCIDMGAYEISCEDISNVLDWNTDGLVNWGDFAGLAAVWRAHDPNDPALTDPNNPRYEYVSDPSGFAQAANLARWFPNAPKYNVTTTGYSEYAIDFADLVALIESPEWLVWQACWLQGEYLQMMFGGDGSGQSAEFETMKAQAVLERSAQEQILDLAGIMVQLENIWLTDPEIQQEIDAGDWQQFMEALYGNLVELYMEAVPIE